MLLSIQVLRLLRRTMARLTLTLNDELDKKLRETVAQTIGFKKGNLQVAIEQALEEWIRKQKPKKGD